MQQTRGSIRALIIVLIAVGGLAVYGDGSPTEARMGGTEFRVFPSPSAANDFNMSTLDGKKFALSDLKGKVVLLNFWRSNCPYCVREKQGLKKMLGGLDRQDLECVCVNFWDSPSWVSSRYRKESSKEIVYAVRPTERSAVVENKVRGRVMGYYVINDHNEAIYEIKGFPSTYVIDRRGKVVATHLGMVDWMNRGVRGWLLGLLGPGRSIDLARSLDAHDYALPIWIDRLLTSPGLPPGAKPTDQAVNPPLK